MNLHDYDITKEAFEKGMNEGLTPEQISNAIGLPLEQVVELKNSLTVNS